MPSGVRELYGLTLYRLGEYRKAAQELEAFRTLSGSTELNAVLADCYRALHRWTAVAELWNELRRGLTRSRSGRRRPHRDGRRVGRSGQAPAAIALLERSGRAPAASPSCTI